MPARGDLRADAVARFASRLTAIAPGGGPCAAAGGILVSSPEERCMKGDKKVIEHLNAVLTNELTSINQYFLHSRMFRNWGLEKLAHHEYEESVDEMKHADRLIGRILFLEGLPNLQQLNKLLIGENVEEALKCDLRLELGALPMLKEAVAYCETVQDYVSRELFEDILESEEEHVDWLETQAELIARIGIQYYTQSQMDGGSPAS
jgi:bacterioferritin